LSAPVYANDCAEVVEATLAEIRAGITEALSEDTEALIRSAAGSACVKANSGLYGAGDNALSSEPIGADDTESSSGKESGDELVIKPLTSAPTKKPYERARLQTEN